MKILFISSGTFLHDDYPFPSHGGAIQIWNMARKMVDLGHSVYITKRDKEDGSENINNINFIKIKVGLPDVSFLVFVNQIVFSIKLLKHINKIKPRVIFLRERFPCYIPSKLSNKPFIYTLYSPDACDFFKTWSIKNKKIHTIIFPILKWIEESIMSRSFAVIVFHEEIAHYLLKKNFNNVHIVPLGINFDEIPMKTEKENFILYAGRLDWNKRVEVLVKAFSQLSKNIDVTLKIIGSGEKLLSLRKLALEEGIQSRIDFLPWMNRFDLLDCMLKAKVFVLPSMYEMFPNVILEAMACYTPVVASNTMGARAIIRNGYNGFIFEKENAQDLKEKLELLLINEELGNRISKNARKNIENNYRVEDIAKQYISVYTHGKTKE
jgi:GalNAc-alpha-(1->4)-GalNAc-alpha-(1->3)-diNAcBac-PP-undecaprenol alpha-1,4-N-acetyl-D-galactosaminyltransferase